MVFSLFHHLVPSLSTFQSIHRIKKDSGSQLTVDEVVDRIFQAADSDGDGDYLFTGTLSLRSWGTLIFRTQLLFCSFVVVFLFFFKL